LNKKITLEFEDLNVNAFILLGQFTAQARIEGWTKEEINTVLVKAKSTDFSHLVNVLLEHCK